MAKSGMDADVNKALIDMLDNSNMVAWDDNMVGQGRLDIPGRRQGVWSRRPAAGHGQGQGLSGSQRLLEWGSQRGS